MATAKFQLPASEDELWRQVLVTLLRQRDVTESQARDHLRLLEELAFHKRFCQRHLSEDFAIKAATFLADEIRLSGPGDKAREWLEDLEQWELLIRRETDRDVNYEFAIDNELLSDYFAACRLARALNAGNSEFANWIYDNSGKGFTCDICKHVLPPFNHYFWHEDWEAVFILLSGLLEDATLLIERIRAEPDDVFHRMLAFAARCLSKVKNVAEELDEQIVEAVCADSKWGPQAGYLHILESLHALVRKKVGGSTQQLEACIQGLEFQYNAVDSLGKIGGHQALVCLRGILNDTGRHVDERCEAARVLGRIGDLEVVRTLHVILEDVGQNWLVRWGAVTALKDLGITTELRVVEILRQILTNRTENGRFRRLVANILGEIEGGEISGVLFEIFEDLSEDPDLREGAGFLLMRLGKSHKIANDRLFMICQNILQNRSNDYRVCALMILANMRGLDAAALRNIVVDKSESARLRQLAMRTLAQVDSPLSISLSESLLTEQHENPEVRGAAADLMIKIGGPEATRFLKAIVSNRQVDLAGRYFAAHVLGTSRDSGTTSILCSIVMDEGEDKRLRSGAASALQLIGDPKAFSSLVEVLKSVDDRDLCLAVIDALGAIGNPNAFGILCRLLEDKSEDSYLRCKVIRALGNINSSDAIQILTKILHVKYPTRARNEGVNERSAAGYALRKIGGPLAVAALMDHRDLA